MPTSELNKVIDKTLEEDKEKARRFRELTLRRWQADEDNDDRLERKEEVNRIAKRKQPASHAWHN